MAETWKAVVGFEGIYEVSDHGRVRRIAPWSDGRKTKPSSELVGKISHNGYRRVSLRRDGKQREFAVHRLVAAAFIGPLPSPIHQVNHKNGRPKDNRYENLEYLTPSQNQLHACRVLHRPSRPGSKHHNAKLTESDVMQIRTLYAQGVLQKHLAEKFGVGCSVICQVCSRQLWSHI